MNRIQKIIRATGSKLQTLRTNFIISPLFNERGEGFLDVAMKVLVVVVIGIAVLSVMNLAVPGLFTALIGRITAELVAG